MEKAKSYRILLVDDNPSVHTALRALIEPLRLYEVCGTAFDGIEAAERAYAERPDLVFMDIAMPRRSGIEATQQIRRFDKKVPILFYSGHPELAEPGLAAGGNGFIAKPASANEVRAALAAVGVGGAYVDGGLWETFCLKLMRRQSADSLLSEEEQKIVPLLLEGRTSKEIGAYLDKPAKRVEKARARMMAVLGARNATALAVKLTVFFPKLEK